MMMSGPDWLSKIVYGTTGGAQADSYQRLSRKARWHLRGVVRWLKLGALMIGSAIVIPVTMISLGILLGPKGYEGLIAAPLAVLLSWVLILFWGLRGRSTAKSVEKSSIAKLPDRVSGYLEQYRFVFPAAASQPLDELLAQLEGLGDLTRGLPASHPGAVKLRRLLSDELTPLVEHYVKLPRQVRTEKLHGSSSPDERLSSGLGTIARELSRVREALSTDDLKTFATQQRYLELKYDEEKPD